MEGGRGRDREGERGGKEPQQRRTFIFVFPKDVMRDTDLELGQLPQGRGTGRYIYRKPGYTGPIAYRTM